MTSQTEGKYILFMWNDYRIIPLIIDKEQKVNNQQEEKYIMYVWQEGSICPEVLGTETELLNYWHSNKKQLTGWLLEDSDSPQEIRDLYEKAIHSHIKSIKDLESICADLNYSWWFIDIKNLNIISPLIADGEYVWVEFIDHSVPTPYSYTVRSQVSFDSFESAISAASNRWKTLYPYTFEYDKSAVFWVAPSKDDGTMALDEAQFLWDFCLGCDYTRWRELGKRHETLARAKAYEYEPER